MTDTDLMRKGVRITPPELMKSAFKGYDLPKTLMIAAAMEGETEYRMNLTGKPENPLLSFFSERCTHNGTGVFGRSPKGATVFGKSLAMAPDRHRSMWDQVRPAFTFPKHVIEVFEEVARYVIYSPQTDFLRGVQSGHIHSPPIGLHGEGLPDAIRELLRRYWLLRRRKSSDHRDAAIGLIRRALNLAFLPGWARRIRVGHLDEYLTSRDLTNRSDAMVYFIDKFMHRRRNKLSAYDSSEGTLFLLFTGVLIGHPHSPQTFGFDNVDAALNPRITRGLVEAIIYATKVAHDRDLAFGPRQMFLTSHHPSSLDALDLFDDHQRLFVVERNDSGGHTTITRVKPSEGMTKDDWHVAKSGRRLSQLCLDGEIRGALGQRVSL